MSCQGRVLQQLLQTFTMFVRDGRLDVRFVVTSIMELSTGSNSARVFILEIIPANNSLHSCPLSTCSKSTQRMGEYRHLSS